MNEQKYMIMAINLAKKAFINGDIPVGAVVVNENGEVIGASYNQKEKDHDPTKHAEILAISLAAQKKRTWRLENCIIYVTLEPCLMCIGAILQARIKHVVYGLASNKYGFINSLVKLSETNNKRIYTISYHYQMVKDSKILLQTFFHNLRHQNTMLLQLGEKDGSSVIS